MVLRPSHRPPPSRFRPTARRLARFPARRGASRAHITGRPRLPGAMEFVYASRSGAVPPTQIFGVYGRELWLGCVDAALDEGWLREKKVHLGASLGIFTLQRRFLLKTLETCLAPIPTPIKSCCRPSSHLHPWPSGHLPHECRLHPHPFFPWRHLRVRPSLRRTFRCSCRVKDHPRRH